LEEAGVKAQVVAPDRLQMHTVNHLNGEAVEPGRNCLEEAARIARGEAVALDQVDPSSFDAVIVPGGFGAAKNFCDFAVNGAEMALAEDVKNWLGEFVAANKPVGLMCIAPVMAPALYGEGVRCTIGHDAETIAAITAMGGTHVECEACTLKYAIFGVFGYCPDCAVHNSLQILVKNLELAQKELAFAETNDDEELSQYLIADALENAVAAFDGFGREITAMHKDLAKDPTKAASMSFQNLVVANEKVEKQFDFRLESGVDASQWTTANRCFQKRHLLAHKMGVVDQKYLDSTGDPIARCGHKIPISIDEVRELLVMVETLGRFLFKSLKGLNDKQGRPT